MQSSPSEELRTPPPRIGHPTKSNTSPDVFEQALREHAYELGIDFDEEPQFKWIAEVGPLSHLELT
jgi:hypothetical protein